MRPRSATTRKRAPGVLTTDVTRLPDVDRLVEQTDSEVVKLRSMTQKLTVDRKEEARKPWHRKTDDEGSWLPKKRLARVQMEELRQMAKDDPNTWTPVTLAKHFAISHDAVVRILKSRFVPDLRRSLQQDRKALRQKTELWLGKIDTEMKEMLHIREQMSVAPGEAVLREQLIQSVERIKTLAVEQMAVPQSLMEAAEAAMEQQQIEIPRQVLIKQLLTFEKPLLPPPTMAPPAALEASATAAVSLPMRGRGGTLYAGSPLRGLRSGLAAPRGIARADRRALPAGDTASRGEADEFRGDALVVRKRESVAVRGRSAVARGAHRGGSWSVGARAVADGNGRDDDLDDDLRYALDSMRDRDEGRFSAERRHTPQTVRPPHEEVPVRSRRAPRGQPAVDLPAWRSTDEDDLEDDGGDGRDENSEGGSLREDLADDEAPADRSRGGGRGRPPARRAAAEEIDEDFDDDLDGNDHLRDDFDDDDEADDFDFDDADDAGASRSPRRGADRGQRGSRAVLRGRGSSRGRGFGTRGRGARGRGASRGRGGSERSDGGAHESAAE